MLLSVLQGLGWFPAFKTCPVLRSEGTRHEGRLYPVHPTAKIEIVTASSKHFPHTPNGPGRKGILQSICL